MVQLNLVLDTRRSKSDGTYSIIFRITQFKTVYTISTGISVPLKFWNNQTKEVKKDCPNAQLINLKLSKKHYELQNAILKLDDDDFNIEELKLLIKGSPKKIVSHTFKSYSDQLIEDMFAINKTGNALVYKIATNRFLKFCGNDKILFKDINYSILISFKQQLELDNVKINSIGNYLRTLRAIYNKAIKAKIVDRSLYPFFDIKIKTEKTVTRAILKEDLDRLRQVVVNEKAVAYSALNYLLLSFYLRGISFTDLAYLKPENIVDGRIIYRRRKTHKNYNIKLFPQAEAIFNQFYKEGSKYLLPVLPSTIVEDSLEAKKLISQWIKTTNKYLRQLGLQVGIKTSLSSYCSRHSFASTAKKLGYSNELIAEALGHEYGNKITNIYLDSFDREVVDEMHERVICLKPSPT